MSTPTLQTLQQKIADLKKARKYQAHFTAVGYQRQTYRVHTAACDLNIALQYDCGGTNYWNLKQCAPGLAIAFEKVIAEHAASLIAEAVQLCEEQVEDVKDKAKAEYKALFDETLLSGGGE